VIDSHVHLYPEAVNRDPAGWANSAGEKAWALLCTRRRKEGAAVQSFPTLDELLAAMDAAEMSRAILLGWYWQNAATCMLQNRFYADCVQRHPDRLSAFATLQPVSGRDLALAEMRRARDDGLCGLGELSPHAQSYAINDPVFGEILETAAQWKWPVNLHVTDPESREYPGRVQTPLEDLSALARTFPATNFILAHWGGLLPLHDQNVVGLPNVFYDTAASPLLYDESVWRRFLAVVPSDRVLFGSDYPLNNYPKQVVVPEMMRLIAEARGAGAGDMILGGNAARLLGL
jgi:predicted TIM-barrel fold metal-dependent hydrolase